METASGNDAIHRPLFNADVLANALNSGGSRPLLKQLEGPTLTVADVRDETSRFLQALQAVGVTAGDRISLIAPNRPECLHLTHALQMLAALYVPIHPLSALNDQLNVIRDAGVKVMLFDAERFEGRAAEIQREVPGIRLLSIGRSTLAEDIHELAAGFVPQKLVPPPSGEHDVIRLGYSGGTTGKPKAIPSCQRSGFLTGLYMQAVWEWPEQPNILSCAPLTHAGGAMFMPALLRGGTFLILPRFDPLQVMEMIESHRINCMMLVPTMIYALLDHPRFGEFDLSSLETIFYGASAIIPARLKEAIERMGPIFAQFYGQAEAPMVLTYMRKRDHDPDDPLRLASCGQPSPWVRLELHDAYGNPVPDGEPGEIVVQGPLVMDGYRDPELTAEAFKGDWLHTGDVAVRDPGGFLRIVDRTKDMIISGGFNIYPRDIENVIAENPAVAEVAVIGVPHDRWGEAVHAVIVLKPGMSVSEEDLCAPVAARKGAYQAPKSIEFVEAIPQTPVGKPDKKALRARHAEAADSQPLTTR
ncbi:AMP-binding protein [Novosphingobium album (ex Hu et al. 2023)]|uniref:AMP-binding protein n=1 Tax=Novosphingobium album (ex Hu et al. 2023) TaxID=2930093 RepID=A0ABT0AZG1_9SPHN|nr:AMP-binding protein [Novosphingobium album (ex Hu et al. 2023)]MCJ2178196.1 AMP-binding protein [Novosphingobium album (ex Hu et al. 2023)]